MSSAKGMFYTGSAYALVNSDKLYDVADTVYGYISLKPPVTLPQLIGNRIKTWIIDPISENRCIININI